VKHTKPFNLWPSRLIRLSRLWIVASILLATLAPIRGFVDSVLGIFALIFPTLLCASETHVYSEAA
jgi:hypothetical protein